MKMKMHEYASPWNKKRLGTRGLEKLAHADSGPAPRYVRHTGTLMSALCGACHSLSPCVGPAPIGPIQDTSGCLRAAP